MPIDASSDPYDGTVDFDPTSTDVKAGDLDDIADSKLDPDLDADDLEAAGTGARTVDLDLEGIDKGAPALDDDLGKDFDVDLDDAGNGAKVDPSLDLDDGPVGKDIGSALDDVDLDDDVVKDFDEDIVKDFDDVALDDLGVGDDVEGTGIKGLIGVDLDDDSDLDVKDDDLFDV